MKTHKTLIATLVVCALAAAATPVLAAEEVVNVNEADESQLALLPRIGPALAGRIVEFREENGKFQQTEDLMLVRGIGEKTLDLLRPFVTTSGETTLSSKVSLSQAQEAADKAKGREDGAEERDN